MNEIVKIAYDAYKNDGCAASYSRKDTMDTLQAALIDANGGSAKLDYKSIRDGKARGFFTIIEEILNLTNVDELNGDEFFMNYVDYRNVALGDQREFWVPNNSLFVVSEVAEGTQGVRRQRLNVGQSVTIPTTLKAIKIYEEMNRLLSGRVDMNEFIALVSRSFKKRTFRDIYTAWNSITAATLGANYYPAAGSYSEELLLDVVSHVEAATDKMATIVGTKKAVRKIKTDSVSDTAKQDMYDMGFYGKFNGVPIMTMKQTHVDNTDNFLMDDNKLYVVVSDMKPIKHITEGEIMVHMPDMMSNADMTQDFFYTDRNGTGVIVTDKFGVYEIA